MENQNTVGAQFKMLQIIHAALCIGIIIILAIFRYLIKQDATAIKDDSILFEATGVGIAFFSVMSSRFLFFIRTKPAMSVASLGEKLDIYRGAYILQMALLEGAALLNCVLFYTTKNDLHFFIALGVLLLMIWRRPTRVMAAMVLFNDMEDKQQIYNDSLIL